MREKATGNSRQLVTRIAITSTIENRCTTKWRDSNIFYCWWFVENSKLTGILNIQIRNRPDDMGGGWGSGQKGKLEWILTYVQKMYIRQHRIRTKEAFHSSNIYLPSLLSTYYFRLSF